MTLDLHSRPRPIGHHDGESIIHMKGANPGTHILVASVLNRGSLSQTERQAFCTEWVDFVYNVSGTYLEHLQKAQPSVENLPDAREGKVRFTLSDDAYNKVAAALEARGLTIEGAPARGR